MRKARTLLGFGIWVAVLPYLGFPHTWKNVLFTLTGLALAYLGYLSYKKFKLKEDSKKTFENFSENRDFEKVYEAVAE